MPSRAAPPVSTSTATSSSGPLSVGTARAVVAVEPPDEVARPLDIGTDARFHETGGAQLDLELLQRPMKLGDGPRTWSSAQRILLSAVLVTLVVVRHLALVHVG